MTLVGVGLTDVRSVQAILWPAFQADTGVGEELEYRQEVDMPRLLAALGDPGAPRPDVVFVANPAAFEQAGLLSVTDGIGSADVPDAWRDRGERWAPLYVQPVVFVYNNHYAVPPVSWPDLLDRRWSERLVFEHPARMLTTGPALAELSPALGDDWPRFLDQLADQRPLLVADNERSVLEVATGSRWGGLSNWNVARRVRAGSPVRHAFLDPTPCIPGFGAVVAEAQGRDLAARFLRWLTSDAGQRAYARTGRIPAVAEVDRSLTTDVIVPPGIARTAGSVDWLRDPEPWVAAFDRAFPSGSVAAAGKLR
jgi:ABC-type Fe3+ transport system substrate-binding protein